MNSFSFFTACLALAAVHCNSEYMCKQEPIELGIVFDVSKTISNASFTEGKAFLEEFLHQFEIGTARNDVRVSIITYGYGVYPEMGFDLDTYQSRDEMVASIRRMKHKKANRTDTGAGIEYMHRHQMAPSVVRPWAEKVAIVITDGISQNGDFTKQAAASARADDITIFAIGVGRRVATRELVNIAGDGDRVTRVDDYESLSSVKALLATRTCVTKPPTVPPKTPSTTPPWKTQLCGEEKPTDINYVFSPADLGIDAVSKATSFISQTMQEWGFGNGFQYGLVTGQCPDDTGFGLDAYNDLQSVQDRLEEYDVYRLPSLTQQLINYRFSPANAGRKTARRVAVLFAMNQKGLAGIDVEALRNANITLSVVNPAGFPLSLDGSMSLHGRSPRQWAEEFIYTLCPVDHH